MQSLTAADKSLQWRSSTTGTCHRFSSSMATRNQLKAPATAELLRQYELWPRPEGSVHLLQTLAIESQKAAATTTVRSSRAPRSNKVAKQQVTLALALHSR